MQLSTTRCGNDVAVVASIPGLRASGHTHGRASGGGGCHGRGRAAGGGGGCLGGAATGGPSRSQTHPCASYRWQFTR